MHKKLSKKNLTAAQSTVAAGDSEQCQSVALTLIHYWCTRAAQTRTWAVFREVIVNKLHKASKGLHGWTLLHYDNYKWNWPLALARSVPLLLDQRMHSWELPKTKTNGICHIRLWPGFEAKAVLQNNKQCCLSLINVIKLLNSEQR